MRESDRAEARRKLDKEMRLFRQLAKRKNPAPGMLRSVRMELGLRTAELAEKLGSSRTLVHRLERNEAQAAITLKSLNRAASAMGCTVVYGIVPKDGGTLEELAEQRLWKKCFAFISQEPAA